MTRIFTSADKREVSPQEINQLLGRAGLPPRDLEKIVLALQHSLICISARRFKDRTLVGLLRAAGDGIFNLIIWDFVVDPGAGERDVTQGLLLERMKREVKRGFPSCSISVFARGEDLPSFQQAAFVEDQKGVRPMALVQRDGRTGVGLGLD